MVRKYINVVSVWVMCICIALSPAMLLAQWGDMQDLPLPTDADAPEAAEQKSGDAPAAQATPAPEVMDSAGTELVIEASTSNNSAQSDATKDTKSWNISIMYTLGERRKLEQLLEMIRRKRNGTLTPNDIGQIVPEFLPGTPAGDNDSVFINEIVQTMQQDVAPPPPAITEAPVFYLNSIMYKNPQEWSVWINGQRYTAGQLAGEDLEITSVTRQRVALTWIAPDLDYIAPDWEMLLGENAEITVMNDRRTVKFSLQPNQTFVSRAMRVVEGRAAPVSLVDSTVEPEQENVLVFPEDDDATVQDESSTEPADKKSESAAGKKPNKLKEGVQGLIDVQDDIEDVLRRAGGIK